MESAELGRYSAIPPSLTARIEALRGLSHQYAVPLLAAAIQFPLLHPTVPAVVVGARTPAEISEVSNLLDHPIPPDFWHSLEREGLISSQKSHA